MELFKIKDKEIFLQEWLRSKDEYHRKMRSLPFLEKLKIIERLGGIETDLSNLKTKYGENSPSREDNLQTKPMS